MGITQKSISMVKFNVIKLGLSSNGDDAGETP